MAGPQGPEVGTGHAHTVPPPSPVHTDFEVGVIRFDGWEYMRKILTLDAGSSHVPRSPAGSRLLRQFSPRGARLGDQMDARMRHLVRCALLVPQD